MGEPSKVEVVYVPVRLRGKRYLSSSQWKRLGRPYWGLRFVDAADRVIWEQTTDYPARDPIDIHVQVPPDVFRAVARVLVRARSKVAGHFMLEEPIGLDRDDKLRQMVLNGLTTGPAAGARPALRGGLVRETGGPLIPKEAAALVAGPATPVLPPAPVQTAAAPEPPPAPEPPAVEPARTAEPEPPRPESAIPAGVETFVTSAVFVTPASVTSFDSLTPLESFDPPPTATPPPVGTATKFRLRRHVKDDLVIYLTGRGGVGGVRPRAAIRLSKALCVRADFRIVQRVQLAINPYSGEGEIVPVPANAAGIMLSFQKAAAVLTFSLDDGHGLRLPENHDEVTLMVKRVTPGAGVCFGFPDSCLLLKS